MLYYVNKNMKEHNLKKCLFASFGITAAVWLAVFFLGYSTGVDAAITDCTILPGNLVQNCSLENTTPLPPGYISSTAYPGFGYTLSDGYTGLDNWSVLGPALGSNIAILDFPGIAPHGNRFIDVSGVDESTPGVDGEQPGSGIEQTVFGLVVGQKYEVSFYHAGAMVTDINVLLDGLSQGIFTVDPLAPGDTIGGLKWVRQSFTFFATGTSTILTFRNDAVYGPNTEELDNIALIAVPPVPTLTTASGTVTAPFTTTITFDQPVTGLTLSNIVVTNGVASGLSAPTNNVDGTQTYTVTVTPTVLGSVTVSIPATTGLSPSPIISVGNLHNISSNTLNVTYSLYSFTAHVQSNNANPLYAKIGDTITISWTVDINGPSLPTVSNSYAIPFTGLSVTSPPFCFGTINRTCSATVIVGADAPEGLFTFSVSATNNSITQTHNNSTDGSTVTIDRTPPTVLVTSPLNGATVGPTMILTGTCEYSSSASTTVTISGTNFTPNATTATCMPGGTFTTSTLTNTGLGNPTVTASQTDLAGNTGTTNAGYVIDGAAPAITLSTPSATVSGPFVLTITPSETLTGFTIGDITISDPLVNTLSGFIGPDVSGNYHVTINPGSSGITISVAAGVATDAVGNPNTISNTLAIAYSTAVIPPSGGTGGGVVLTDLCNNINDAQFSIPFGMYRQDGNCYSLITQDPQNPPISVPPTINPNTTLSDHCEPYLTKDIILNSVFNDSDEVKKLEQFLNSSEGENLVVNGIYEQVDFEAVKRFQEKYSKDIVAPWAGVAPTGVVGSYTRGKINVMTCAKNTNCPYFNEYHKQGDVGGQVSKIQNFLNILMGEKLQENGIFDRLTFGAVMRYQSRYHVTVLSPWNMKAPSGWWYQSSRFVANDLANCSEVQKTLDNGVTITSKKY
jgi:hypothetical protein